MNALRSSSILVLLVAIQSQLPSQTVRWESMGGPVTCETRTHLRIPDGDRLVIGSKTGTYRTTDNGLTWIHLSPAPGPNFSVSCSRTGVLMGSCDTPIVSYDKHDPVTKSVWRSTDRGEHWIKIFSTRLLGDNAFSGDTVYQLNGYSGGWPAFSGCMYLDCSTDRGAHWRKLLSAYDLSHWPYGIVGVYAQPGNVFVRWAELAGPGLIWRSSDGGMSWQKIPGHYVLFHPPLNLLRTWGGSSGQLQDSIEYSPDNGATWKTTLRASGGFISLISDNITTLLVLRRPGYDLYRSTDAGQSWNSLGNGPAGDPFVDLRFYGQTSLVGTTGTGAYYRSTDCGGTWLPILDPEGAPLIGVIESATDSLFVVSRTDARILESTDAGGTWRQLNSPGERALVTSLLAVPSGSLFAGSTTTISRKRGDEPWRTVPYYWSSTVPVADSIWGLSYRSGPLFVAAGGEGGIQPRAHEGSIIALDTALVTSGTGWALGGNSQWDYSYHGRDYRCVLAKADGSALAGSQGMIVSGARGASQSSQVYSTQGTISALLEDSRGNIWATNDGSGVFVAYGGTGWHASNAGLTVQYALCIASSSPGQLFVGTRGGGVYRSTDSGATWAASGLSGRTVQALATGRGNRVYAGLSDGLYVSDDAGQCWKDASSGLRNTDVRALAVGPDGKVYCGTWGDGVYRLIETPSANLIQNPSFEAGTAPWKFYTSGSGSFSDEISGGLGGHAAVLDIGSPGDNTQLYQTGIRLKAGQRYRLDFKAFSRSGHNFSVYLHKHEYPYTGYGVEGWEVDLSRNSWKSCMTEFTAENFVDSVDDGRLRFWLSPYATAGDQYHIDDVELCETDPDLVINGGFDWGLDPWIFYSNAGGSMQLIPVVGEDGWAAKVTIGGSGGNVQLYQSRIRLQAGERYVLTFRAYSNTGHDLDVYLHQHGAPNTNYGLDVSRIDLGTSWQTYRLECTASDFIGIVRDARLRFWLAPYAEAGDQYYFNEVHLFRKADLGKPGSEPLSDVGTKPQEFALEQNYPNPFNASSHFRFWISEFAAVKLHVFDLLGREVAVLVNEKKDPGSYQVRWDASGFPSGVYIYRLQAGSFVQSRKLVLVK